MSFNPETNLFLLSLAFKLAELTSLTFTGSPRSIWTHQAIEGDSNDPKSTDIYSVLRPYPGPPPELFDRRSQVNVQVDTRGKVDQPPPLVFEQAIKLYEALFDDHASPQRNKKPRYDWTIDGKKLVNGAIAADTANWFIWKIDIQNSPGIVGPDERGRWMAPFSISILFKRAASS